MPPLPSVTEHWTLSKQALVVTGPRRELTRLALQLGLSPSAVRDVDTRESVLGIWGDVLPRYAQFAARWVPTPEVAADPPAAQ